MAGVDSGLRRGDRKSYATDFCSTTLSSEVSQTGICTAGPAASLIYAGRGCFICLFTARVAPLDLRPSSDIGIIDAALAKNERWAFC